MGVVSTLMGVAMVDLVQEGKPKPVAGVQRKRWAGLEHLRSSYIKTKSHTDVIACRDLLLDM